MRAPGKPMMRIGSLARERNRRGVLDADFGRGHNRGVVGRGLGAVGALCAALGCAAVPGSEPSPPRVVGPMAKGPPQRVRASDPAPPPAAVPAPAVPPRFLKGQVHVHTSRSYDAHTAPERVLRFYAERGYDFVALTDHNRVTVTEPPQGLLLIAGVELGQNSASCEPKPTPGYRCLFHMSGLFVDPARDRSHGERIPLVYHPGRLEAYQSQLSVVQALGGLAVLNHPLFHFAADGRMVRALGERGVRLVELWNASLDRQHPAGRAAAEQRAEQLWDEVLGSGAVVYGLASDDAHHFDDAAERGRKGKFAYVGDRAWIMVRAEKEPAKIRAALEAGDFYASTGVTLRTLEVDRSRMRLAVEGGSATTRFIGRGGRELARVEGEHAEYQVTGGEGYVRADITDARGRRAWVQPLVVER
jgi:hypothetical protein